MGKADAFGVCRWQRENEKRKTLGQFHQDQWFVQGWKGTHIYRYQIYFGNRKKYLSKKAIWMLLYKYNSFLSGYG